MLRAVTVTPGSTPPCASATVPPITPRSPCAAAEAASPSVSSRTSSRHTCCCERNTARNLNIAPPGDRAFLEWELRVTLDPGGDSVNSRPQPPTPKEHASDSGSDRLPHLLRRGLASKIRSP